MTSYRNAAFQPTTQQTLFQWPFLAVELQKTHFITQRITAGKTVWPIDAAGNPIMVPAVGYDRRGRAIHFSVPLVYAPYGMAPSSALATYRTLVAAPNATSPSLVVPMGGQRLAYADSKTATTASSAPPLAPPKDDTTFATQTLAFDLVWISNGDTFQQPAASAPTLAPIVTSAAIYVEALHAYLPNLPDGTMPSVNVSYHPKFLAAPGLDLGKNQSQLLFSLASAITADFTKDPSGADRSDCGTGFIAPNMTFNALSRTTGPAYDGTVTPSASTGRPRR